MAIRLGPMGLTDVLDGAFNVYRSRFPVFAGLALLTTIPALTLNVIFDSNYMSWAGSLQNDSGPVASPLGWLVPLLLTLPVHALLLPFYISPLVLVASESILGRPAGIRLALRVTLRRYWGLWLINFLLGALFVMAEYSLVVSLVMVAVAAILLATVAAAGPTAFAAAALSLAIAVFAGGLALLVGWPLVRLAASLPALWAEGASVSTSLGRSWTLTRSASWRTLLILFLALILAQVLTLAGPPVAVLLVFVVPGFNPSLGGALSTIAEEVLGQLGAPVLAIATCLVYYDLRVRREAFDLELMSYRMRAGQTLEATS